MQASLSQGLKPRPRAWQTWSPSPRLWTRLWGLGLSLGSSRLSAQACTSLGVSGAVGVLVRLELPGWCWRWRLLIFRCHSWALTVSGRSFQVLRRAWIWGASWQHVWQPHFVTMHQQKTFLPFTSFSYIYLLLSRSHYLYSFVATCNDFELFFLIMIPYYNLYTSMEK